MDGVFVVAIENMVPQMLLLQMRESKFGGCRVEEGNRRRREEVRDFTMMQLKHIRKSTNFERPDRPRNASRINHQCQRILSGNGEQ